MDFLNKQFLILCFFIFLNLSCNKRSVNYDELILQDGLYHIYDKSKNTILFTGDAYSNFENGGISKRTKFKNGIPFGIVERYDYSGDIYHTIEIIPIGLKREEGSEILRLNLSVLNEVGTLDTNLNVITLKYINDKSIIIKELNRLLDINRYGFMDVNCRLGEYENPYMNLTLYKGGIK